ncbi:MAG: hypothetical protein ACT4QF_05130 [Sporichthyaceae bacterium]
MTTDPAMDVGLCNPIARPREPCSTSAVKGRLDGCLPSAVSPPGPDPSPDHAADPGNCKTPQEADSSLASTQETQGVDHFDPSAGPMIGQSGRLSGYGGASVGCFKFSAGSLIASTALAGSMLPAAVASTETEKASTTDGANALSTFPQFAAIPDSATLDLPLVLRGTVEQITGAVMPGSQVLLAAWPSNESVVDMPVGAEFDVVPMARTVADEAGNYVLRASVTDLLLSLAGPDGIDVELNVFHGDRHYTYLSQVTPTESGGWVRQLSRLDAPVGSVVDAADNLLDLTLDRTKSAVEGGLGVTGGGPVAVAHRKPVPPGCEGLPGGEGTCRSLRTRIRVDAATRRDVRRKVAQRLQQCCVGRREVPASAELAV